ncbi:MAG: hypothetical protein QG620_304 [Patescibacteria group bacterium]|nr:hypothetical protein [Patescibacteria group bacterium]
METAKNNEKISGEIDKKSRIFFAVFFGLIALTVAATFIKYFILKDYYIQAEAECDPSAERCFIYECDPEEDGEDCPEDEAERISYYKLIKKKAYAIPLCDPAGENCPALACQAGEDCEETLCEEDNEEEGIVCNDPAEYVLEENTLGDDEAEDEEECDSEEEDCEAGAGAEDSEDSGETAENASGEETLEDTSDDEGTDSSGLDGAVDRSQLFL